MSDYIEMTDTEIQPYPRVLVIDDDESMLELAMVVLIKEFDVIVSDDAHKGIGMAVEQRPDVILLDITMPMMDGLTALSMLKQFPETKAIPVIMLTAIARKEVIVEAIKEGAIHYIAKPFDKTELKKKIYEVMQTPALIL